MRLTVILITVTLIILFILTQKVDLIVQKGDRLTITADITLFSVVFTDGKAKKRREKKKERPNVRAIYYSLRYLISKSQINIRRLRLSDTATLSQKRGTLFVFVTISTFLTLIKRNAKSFAYTDNAYLITPSIDESPATPYIDISLSFSPFSLIISAFIFLYYLVENKLARKGKNVG